MNEDVSDHDEHMFVDDEPQQVLDGMLVSKETVRRYILREYEVTDELVTAMFESHGNAMIEHDIAMASFTYWCGDRIVEKYNEPIVQKIADADKRRRSFVTDEDLEGISACDEELATLRASLYLSRETIDELDGE